MNKIYVQFQRWRTNETLMAILECTFKKNKKNRIKSDLHLVFYSQGSLFSGFISRIVHLLSNILLLILFRRFYLSDKYAKLSWQVRSFYSQWFEFTLVRLRQPFSDVCGNVRFKQLLRRTRWQSWGGTTFGYFYSFDVYLYFLGHAEYGVFQPIEWLGGQACT